MNPKLKTRQRSICLPSAIFTTLLGIAPFACADAPATTPSGDVDIKALAADIQQANKQLAIALPDDTLADAGKRAIAAPKAVPVLKRIDSDFAQLVAAKPAMSQRLSTGRQQVAAMLIALDDPSAVEAATSKASSSDPKEAAQGHGVQLYARWYEAGKSTAAQLPVIDDLEKLDRANPNNSGLAILTVQMSNTAATPAVRDRMRKLATVDMTSPASVALKRQLDAATEAKAKKDAVLGKLLDKSMVLSGTQPDGSTFSTAAWKGKVVLVDFWATWCGPCKAELPRVKQIYSQYHPKGLELIGISNDYKAEDLKKFVVEQQMPWPELFDANAASDQQWNPITLNFGINGIPTMFLIDKKGVARSVTAREDMEVLIPQLLAERG